LALLKASPRAGHALAALRETLSLMSARIVDQASISVPLPGAKPGGDDIVAHPQIAPALAAALHVEVCAV